MYVVFLLEVSLGLGVKPAVKRCVSADSSRLGGGGRVFALVCPYPYFPSRIFKICGYQETQINIQCLLLRYCLCFEVVLIQAAVNLCQSLHHSSVRDCYLTKRNLRFLCLGASIVCLHQIS